MSEDHVRAFWAAMGRNDFALTKPYLHPQFELYFPQSKELLTGPEDFVAFNTAYPAHGAWRFKIRRVVAQGQEAVSDVQVTDGQQKARVIAFHSFQDGLIRRQVEYWPEAYAPQGWRSHLMTVVDAFAAEGNFDVT